MRRFFNANDHIDAELPETFCGRVVLGTGPPALVLPELSDGCFELGAVDNSDVILGGILRPLIVRAVIATVFDEREACLSSACALFHVCS